jgi:hypothetical protein
MEEAGYSETLINICRESQNLYSGSFNDTFNSLGYIMLNGKDYLVNNELERTVMKLLYTDFRHYPSLYWERIRKIVKM